MADGYGFEVSRADLEANGLHARLKPANPGGCWAVYYYDMRAEVESVHAHEIAALRAALTSDMHAQVVWMPWGTRLDAAIAAAEAAKKAPDICPEGC